MDSPTSRLLMCPHIIDSIAAHAARPTQVVLLRVSRQFFVAAGKALYRCVKVDGHNIPAFFRGVYPNLDHLYGSNIDADFLPDTITGTPAPATGSKGKKKKKGKKSKNNKKKGGKTNPASKAPTVANESGNATEVRDDATEPSSENETTTHNSDEPELTLATFKNHLLKYVQVFTIGSHPTAFCRTDGADIAKILPSVQTLRVAPNIQTMFTLHKLCETETEEGCPFLHLPMHKLVVRNLDGNGIGRWCPDYWDPAGLEEVVLFFPTDGRAYARETYVNSIMELGLNWDSAKSIEIVFYQEWETWNATPNALKHVRVRYRYPIMPHDIIGPFENLLTYLHQDYVVYGLESLSFSAAQDHLVEAFQEFFPDIALTQDRLRQLVRDEMRTGSLGLYVMGGGYKPDNDIEEHIFYLTLQDYLDEVDWRPAEINAED